MTRIPIGRYVFGLAGIAFGLIALVFHDFNGWQQIRPLGQVPHREILASIVGVIELLGGIAVLWPRTARVGAVALGTLYLIFALLWLPIVIAGLGVWDSYANFFEQFSLVSGAVILYATAELDKEKGAKMARFGYLAFGVCVVSFMLEQAFYLSGTASFVPKWIPLGQMFWAVATTIAFALAAIALLSGRSDFLAARLLTLMILGFGLLVWLPTPFADPHNIFNWAGNAENTAILGAAWIVTDYLRENRPLLKPALA